MTRREFTANIARLILEMVNAGEQPVLDFAVRSPEEQNRLFKLGVTKCDGYKIKSRHNQGLAVDLYLATDDGVIWEWPKEKAEYWHKRWCEITGAVDWIHWDAPHFSSDGK